ncbi:BZ3500_MvSof-1268-A1-R1_Chr1-3g02011 [Microbotryum saponariae]|uniref:5-formyltetrahydrofolate cyclo-ligase n=1 Tax=Microbotryum saponariae TaxID=289078 RepID=A0A2X0KTT7_9BASI|nr:BZ3500_MvSof-1268-A1-R1_Chr1-3g02011 [Microbotryum saponariae]SCZ95156.1 BZ3501_MvSof-1269-A2-R1_Chr1-3g01613 [Microbotryum saponariae]
MSSSASTATTQAAKALLRKSLKRRLKLVPRVQVAQESAAIAARVLAASWYVKADAVSCYLSTPVGEASTDSIILDALSKGKRVFIPFCPLEQPTVMRMLRLKSVQHFESLQLNRWGIRELDPREVRVVDVLRTESEQSGGLDLILVPGLAFDRKKRRLGHGRGYYDRYMTETGDYPTRFNKHPPYTAALALQAQMIEQDDPDQIPVTEWDRRPDALLAPFWACTVYDYLFEIEGFHDLDSEDRHMVERAFENFKIDLDDAGTIKPGGDPTPQEVPQTPSPSDSALSETTCIDRRRRAKTNSIRDTQVEANRIEVRPTQNVQSGLPPETPSSPIKPNTKLKAKAGTKIKAPPMEHDPAQTTLFANTAKVDDDEMVEVKGEA